MAYETKYIVQCYALTKAKTLTKGQAYEATNSDAVIDRANRLFESGNYIGVDAFSFTADPEAGEYNDPVFLIRLGQTPNMDD